MKLYSVPSAYTLRRLWRKLIGSSPTELIAWLLAERFEGRGRPLQHALEQLWRDQGSATFTPDQSVVIRQGDY